MTFDLASLLIGFFAGIVVMLLIYTRSRGAAYEARLAELNQALTSTKASWTASQAEAEAAQKELKTADRELKKMQKASEKAEKTAFELENATAQITLLEAKLSASEARLAELEAQAALPAVTVAEPAVDLPADTADAMMTLPREPKPKDLQLVEGIGPKIADLLIAADIYDLADLAEADVAKIEEVLNKAGRQYQLADPRTWIEQAVLGARGEWEAMKAMQERLKGGRTVE